MGFSSSEVSKSILLLMFIGVSVALVSGTEIESGYFKADSTGKFKETVGFRPDYIEFITAQQIQSVNTEGSPPTNRNCPENVNGWSEGSVLFDPSGVEKQFSIGAFRNSDSTNDHRVASSTSHVIKNVYAGRNGGKCGELRVSVVRPLKGGFEADIESVGPYNEIVRYKAYQFPDNMDFDAGMIKIKSEGNIDVNDLNFQPANIHIRAGQQISSKNIDKQFEDNDPEQDNTLGRSKGYVTLNREGNVIDQQSIGTASSSDSTNAHRSIASDKYVLNTAYVGQDGNLFGRLRAKVTGTDSQGFNMDVADKWSGTDEIVLYRAWGFSYYDFKIGYKVIDSDGTKTFDTGFRPDAIDIYAEQQISNINNEVVTPTNSGCDNAGGWSNGFYEADDNRQWALATGRTSDSQNSHRYASTNSHALFNKYTGHNGGDCGDFTGTVTGASSTGFSMDFSTDSAFQSNYDKEMVYYRAFNFRIAPPQVENVWFINSTQEHKFTVKANISEGSNDIAECEFDAWDSQGNHKIYTNSSHQLGPTRSQCIQTITYNDDPDWESTHNNKHMLPNLTVKVTASDVDGQQSHKIGENTFPNHPVSVSDVDYTNYTKIHGFNITAKLADLDAKNKQEIKSCIFNFRDGEGNTLEKSTAIDYSFGTSDQAKCKYSSINSSISGFKVLEEIDVHLSVKDYHGRETVFEGSHSIPNSLPFSTNPNPSDGGYTSKYPVPLSAKVNDPEGDTIDVTVFNGKTGNRIYLEKNLNPKEVFEYDWETPDAKTSKYKWNVQVEDKWSSRNLSYFFTKTLGSTYRSKLSVDMNYSSIIVNEKSNKYAELTIQNNVQNTKNLTVSLKGVNSEFLNGKTSKTLSNFEGKESKKFMIRIAPQKPTNGNLVITVQNNDLGIKTREKIPVTVLSSSVESNEVPGLGIIQLIFLVLSATVLYSEAL